MELQIELVISQIIAFLIVLWVMKRYAWKPLLTVMEDRRNKIQGEFDSIEEQKKEINRLKKEYKDKLANIDAEAKLKYQEELNKGKKAGQDVIAQAHKDAKEIIFKAQADAEAEVQKAKIQLKEDLVNLVMASTKKVIQKDLDDPKKQKALIEEFLEQGAAK